MPIQHHKSGATIITGDSVDFFRLLTMRAAVSLELKGMRATRGPVVWKRVAKEFGIKGNKQKIFEWLEAKIAEEREKQEHRTEDGKRIVAGMEVQ